MTWINAPLNTVTVPPPSYGYIEQLWQKGYDLITDIKAATTAISSLALPEPDLTGITLTQTDPSGVSIVLPSAPTPISITPPTPGSNPDDSLIITLIAAIRAQLEYRLANPTGLAASVESALFSRGVDRETALQAESYNNYLANQASNGFSSASGNDAAAFIAFETQKKQKLSDLQREIMITQANLEQTNVKDALQQMNVLAQNSIALLNSQEDIMVKRVQIYNDINKITIDLYAADVNAYQTTGNMTVEKARLLTEQVNAINDLNANLTNVALEKVKVMNAYELGKHQTLSEDQKAVGATLGQLSASIFNTVSYSESWSESKSWSGSESVST